MLNNFLIYPGFTVATSGILIKNCNWCIAAANQVSGYTVGLDFAQGGQNIFRDNTVLRAAGSYRIADGSASAGPNNSPTP